MEKELNIAAILKDKPQGTKLYDWLYNIDIELDTISTTDTETVVWCTNETDNNTTCHRGYSEFGTVRNCPNGLQILLPSRGMRDWSKFAWKKGDVLVNSCGFQCIFKEWKSDDYTKFNGCYSNSRDGYEDVSNAETAKFDKLDNNIAYGYVREIERKLGGILNLETLEIEKAQPEFKDGDVIIIMPHIGDKLIYLFKAEDDEKYYGHAFLDGNIAIVNEDSYCPKDFCTARPATDEEKQELFSDLEKKNKRWNPDTKQIEDLPKKYELKPMDWCLMKDSTKYWELCQFAYTRKVHGTTIYSAVGGLIYYKCIPYNEETAHLLGTTDEWKGGEG